MKYEKTMKYADNKILYLLITLLPVYQNLKSETHKHVKFRLE